MQCKTSVTQYIKFKTERVCWCCFFFFFWAPEPSKIDIKWIMVKKEVKTTFIIIRF